MPDLPDNDDLAAEMIADALTELARRPGSLRLAVMQMTGLAATEPTQEQRAAANGLSLDQQARLERRALEKIRLRLVP